MLVPVKILMKLMQKACYEISRSGRPTYVAKRIRNTNKLYSAMKMFAGKRNSCTRNSHSQQSTGFFTLIVLSSTVCGVVLECGCEYYVSSVDAAGGHGSVEKINSRWRRLPRV